MKNVFKSWCKDPEFQFTLQAVRMAKQAFRTIRVYLDEPYSDAAKDMIDDLRRWEVMIEATISGNNTRDE